MTAEQSVRDGNLKDAITQLQDQVRKEPAEPKHRVFLFQLLAVTGQWDRALTQLSVVSEMDASTLMMAQAYREAIQCEALRTEVFAGQRSPLLFGEPEQWQALMMEALRCTAQGSDAQADELRNNGFDAAPATAGKITTSADEQQAIDFEWIADGDTRLGPIIEAFVNGRYYWIPFHRIREIQVEAPADLRDLVWMPAHFVWTNGGDAVALIPTRYAGSESSEDNQIRMSRKTEWLEYGTGGYRGLGQRVLSTDAGEFSLMDIRKIELDTPDEPGEANENDVTATPEE